MNEIDPFAPRDPLAEALHFVRMNGAFYCRCELTAPWGMTMPLMPRYLWFHAVISGAVWLEAGDGESRWLSSGEVALVPRGEDHVLRSEPGVPAPGVLELELERVSERYEILRHGEGGAPSRMICGAVRFDDPAVRNLIEALPATVHITASDSPQVERIQRTLTLIAAEASHLQPGGEAVIMRLADVLVIQAIRSWIQTDPAARTGWLGALQDPQIGLALASIHRDPGRAWTLASLADEAAMSRSRFAARFTQLVGESAISYVTRWRMQVANEALQSPGTTVAELAGRLGYRSEAAFARAFKRVLGVPPGTVKRVRSNSPAPGTIEHELAPYDHRQAQTRA